ncbi:MAG: type II secretion system F family protein [archaeon]
MARNTLFFRRLAKHFPGLDIKLAQARMPDTPEYYVRKTFMNSLLMAFGLALVAWAFVPSGKTLILFPFLWIIVFLYMIRFVDATISKFKKGINMEIVFAGRFLLIELESGVPVYQAFQNMVKNYEVIGLYFSEIIDRVNLGTTLEDAINETMILTPSPNLRKLLWQILNSLKTGADVGNALSTVINQIVREQRIAVKEYGRKLNPLSMFYMLIAVIVPSLGIALLVIFSTFIGFKLDLAVLMTLAGLVGFVQFMFLALMRSARPPVEV